MPQQYAVVTLKRTSDKGAQRTSYDVYADGVHVGRVEQQMTTFDRKPKGSRIVTRRTQSLRWYGIAKGEWRHSFDRVTRWEAIADVLRHTKEGTMAWDWQTSAKSASVIKEN